MIPQEKSEAVRRGLREAFGVSEFEDISRITRGLTASLVFRIVVRGSPYLFDTPLHQHEGGSGARHRAWSTPMSTTMFPSGLCRS